MPWYKTGTVSVTSASPTVNLSGGDALQNIFPDDGFFGPDGKLYPILTVNGASQFTLAVNYAGSTASGQSYLTVPVADYTQLRDLLSQVNVLVTDYQSVKLNAGTGQFASGSAALPGIRSVSDTNTGLVWNNNDTLSVSTNGSISVTFSANGTAFPDGTVSLPSISFGADTDTGFYRPGTNILGLVTGGVERLRIAADGRIGIGVTTLTHTLEAIGSDGSLMVGNGRTANTIKSTWFYSPAYSTAVNGRVITFYTYNDVNNNVLRIGGGQSGGQAATQLGFYTAAAIDTAFGTMRWSVASDGHFLPSTNNTYDVGSSSQRVRQYYGVNGTINTSDANVKTEKRDLTPEELSAATRIAKTIGIFKFLDAVALKGDDAREHVGIIAQDVWAIMADEGLIDPLDAENDPTCKYAFLCWDQWDAVEAVMDDDGSEIQAVQEAGNLFSIRPDQLALFLIAAQEARLTALENLS